MQIQHYNQNIHKSFLTLQLQQHTARQEKA